MMIRREFLTLLGGAARGVAARGAGAATLLPMIGYPE